MSYFYKKKGFGLFQFIITIACAGVMVVLLTRIAPVYFNDYVIQKVLSNTDKNFGINRLTSEKTKVQIIKVLSLNAIDYLQEKDINVTEVPKGLHVSIQYEVRKKLIANMDVIMTFHNEVDLIEQ